MRRSRERILQFGIQGTGKTRDIFAIMSWLSGTGARYYYIDTDDTVERFLEAPHYQHLAQENGGPLIHLPAFEWEEIREHRDRIKADVQEGDWIILDFASQFWEKVQEWYVKRVWKMDFADYLLMVREAMKKDAKSLKAFEGWKDWPAIKSQYFSVMDDLLFKNRAHVYMTTTVNGINDDDEKLTKAIFGPYGCKPGGQKKLAHDAQTVLLKTTNRDGEIFATTIKDRERRRWSEYKLGESPTQFAKSYLMGVAGWRK